MRFLPGPDRDPGSFRSMRGFSLLELLTASFLSLLVIIGIQYVYKGQQKNMLVSSSVSELRMNGQYTLNEVQHHLLHAGLGLPSGFRNLDSLDGSLVVKMNVSKEGFSAVRHSSSTTTRTYFRLDSLRAGDAFASSGYVLVRGKPTENAIASLKLVAGLWHVEIASGMANFPSQATLYPMNRVILKRETDGGFKATAQDPRNAGTLSNLKLAEGIDSLAYHFISMSGARSTRIPASLDTLHRIEIRVVARTVYKDLKYPGDGYRRKAFSAIIGYRRTL
jgi:hypothetical protein